MEPTEVQIYGLNLLKEHTDMFHNHISTAFPTQIGELYKWHAKGRHALLYTEEIIRDFRLEDDELATNFHRDPRILLGRQKLDFALKLFNLGLDAEAFQLPKLEIELKEGPKTDTTDQNADCRGIKRPTSELEEAGQGPKRQKVEERLPQFLPLGDGKPSSKLEDWEDEASK